MKIKLLVSVIVGILLFGCSQNATPTAVPVVATQPPTATPSPTATNAPPLTYTPLPTATEIVPGMVLFEEDFEDGKADNFIYIADGFEVTTEGNGNKVLEIDTNTEAFKKTDGGTGVGFGSEEWTNYSAEYRVKMLNAKGNAWLSFRNTAGIYYVEWLSAEWDTINLFFSDTKDGWQNVKTLKLSVWDERWYRVRVEAQGFSLRVYLDDNLMIQVEDERIANGDFNMGVFSGTHALFDDIRVTALGNSP
jgi:hypothetical protein